MGAMGWGDWKSDESRRAVEQYRRGERAKLAAAGTRSTDAWDAAHPRATSLARKAAISGVPLRELQAAYRQGWSEWFTSKPRGLTKEQAAMNKASALALTGRA
jgi:hypothetical protein